MVVISIVLTEENLEEIDVPSGVEVNEVMVDAGDSVLRGTCWPLWIWLLC